MRRIKDRYEEFGYTGLFDQRRGKRSIELNRYAVNGCE